MKKLLCLLLVLMMLLPLLPTVRAEETVPVEIYTVEDLLAMAEDPYGSYILMSDLDMTGEEWKSLDFSGSFDGNGHAILNLTLSQPGEAMAAAYDGNKHAYLCNYVGFFGSLTDAEVKNLQLLNVRAVYETDEPCFLASLAGYCMDSTITDCTVTATLELRAHNQIFGVGGLIGYGTGVIENCSLDVTLICVDTDAATTDEQFLGGVIANGFLDIIDCDVVIDGYISEHGYVHSGGAAGLFMEYPHRVGKSSKVKNNSVTGMITFFEDNTNRRAYCAAYLGEALVDSCYMSGNYQDFKRNEVKTYDTELRPCQCETPAYDSEVVPSACDSYGYTRFTCTGCGYSYTDHYTLFSHNVTSWVVTAEPDTEAEGQRTGTCDACGLAFTQTIEKLEPETEPVTEEVTTEPGTQESVQAPTQEAEPVPSETIVRQRDEKEDTTFEDILLYVLAGLLVVVIIIAIVTTFWHKPSKYQGKRLRKEDPHEKA